ncbi:alpha/beta hydrolase [Actinoplanes philippinensis]|uniref:Lysophospholipase, alpha-beta hydrolase superfamily n=1 Tax=Actinoplanes philippinensis TaxID=35752 RepID=A0A1I2KAU3_9ACTN|nr:alpha/beta hydrolase [Actinoplanes philippinensis]GIE81536.1 alpha/beta hydrolase [Actinoplanes philippinensis]SFF62337.1 Lysophospholipase, alpha-beta hydrolase superfamily [Actinoplanes philippinensis]
METDVLGWPYERHTIELGSDDEGPVVATLVRRRAETPSRRAVLHVHGFVDYFFQTHMADFFVERGWDFYALDLRKYGRSLLPHQTPNFARSLTDYFPELDEAVRVIREDDGHDQLLVTGHSTGGLITSLWAHARRDQGKVDGLFLNSPFFDFNLPWLLRRPLMSLVLAVNGRSPYKKMPVASLGLYGKSLHSDHHGEWTYDLAWKPILGFPVTMGWLEAIRRGQRKLRSGLAIDVPVLVACSTRTFRGRDWHEDVRVTDSVLDVGHIVRWAPGLGSRVTIAQFDGGMHDLTLSGKDVRAEVFRELGRWVDGFLPAPGVVEAEIPPAPEDQPGIAAVLEEAEAAVERAAADEADDKSGTTA